MVELDETSSNQLFQTLADWNDQLTAAGVTPEDLFDVGGPQP